MKLTGPSFITHDASSINYAHFTCHCNSLWSLVSQAMDRSMSCSPFGEPFFVVATCNLSPPWKHKGRKGQHGHGVPVSDQTWRHRQQRSGRLLLEFKVRLRRHHDPHSMHLGWWADFILAIMGVFLSRFGHKATSLSFLVSSQWCQLEECRLHFFLGVLVWKQYFLTFCFWPRCAIKLMNSCTETNLYRWVCVLRPSVFIKFVQSPGVQYVYVHTF